MITTLDIITLLKARHGGVSSRVLAEKIGLSHNTINLCFKGHSLSLTRALAYADELGLDRDQVMIGNLCEKHLVTQEVKERLMQLIGEEKKLKTDPITMGLAAHNKTATTQTNTL
jgi:hypothetical protein